MIAALYVATGGVYYERSDVDPWDAARDARGYAGPWSVVAHPPCERWCGMARLNESRYGHAVGFDGGCFRAALGAIRTWGGVIEHPYGSLAWAAHGLKRPRGVGWSEVAPGEWACEVWQSAYGHRARKRTWLHYVGGRPADARWDRLPGTHQIGWFDRAKPTLSKCEAKATPAEFAAYLISLAARSREVAA